MKYLNVNSLEDRRKTTMEEEQADPWDTPFFGVGGGRSPEFRVWDPKQSFDITKAVTFRGNLFARPESSVTKNEIIPSLPYFDSDSGAAFNFWCVGYTVNGESAEPIAVVRGKKWDFNVSRFVEVKQDFEEHTRWKYSGGADLILCNEIVDVNSSDKWLELKSSVCVSIDELLDQKHIRSFESFFQRVVNFAKQYTGSTPSWDFSDSQGLRLAGMSLKESVIHFLPEPLRKGISEAEYFAVRNIGK